MSLFSFSNTIYDVTNQFFHVLSNIFFDATRFVEENAEKIKIMYYK